jgi:hypothetical protein
MIRHFVAVRFNPWDRRTYTYHHEGERLAVGDTVIVATNKGEVTAEVMGFQDHAPPFDTKPIIRKHASGNRPPPEQEQLPL